MKRFYLLFVILGLSLIGKAQEGILAGNVLDEKQKAIEGATVELISLKDTLQKNTIHTNREGDFLFRPVSFGYYKLRISFVGLQRVTIDSLHFRAERYDFNLSDIVLKPAASEQLGEVIVYAEKPLVQSKDGNITFNAAESALAAGSNASELLNNVPLVAKDPNGKITVRGKEPRILIDDKPVELNLQQLQDLLESMPGSSIEKIEVMTNPPPQYANEQGGVINIVTRKGKVGKSGRINVSGGTRGEAGISGHFSYRKQGLALSVTAGLGYNRLPGDGYSSRNNIYADSANFFNTANNFLNKSWRPNLRFNLDYDITKNQTINLVAGFNLNRYDNHNLTTYTNINRMGEVYRLSNRTIASEGESLNPNTSLSYTRRGKLPGEQLRVIAQLNLSVNDNDRDFFQEFFGAGFVPLGIDSTQQQLNHTRNTGYNLRADYNKPLGNKKTTLSFGSFYNRHNSHVEVIASNLKKPEGVFEKSDLLSNHFRFHQTVVNYRASVRHLIKERFSVTAGTSVEQTYIWFELYRDNRDARSRYYTWLPFFNLNRNWKEKYSVTLAYRRTVRRPGINELNPAIDFSDPYNLRFGNENLLPSTAHNFDLVLGYTRPKYFFNLGMGYNLVQDIFAQVRTLIPGEKTQITWQNISDRKEYEASAWGGVTLTKKLRANFSTSYTYNVYSDFDKRVNRYRDGGSFTSNISGTYTPRDVWNFTGSFVFNRFANPQGYARWNWSMNLGVQRKFFDKRFTVTFNLIDPFLQENRNYTEAPNFILRSFNTNRTRNFRLSLGYNLTKPPKKPAIILPAGKK